MPAGAAITSGASVGTTVGAGTDVLPADGTEVGAAGDVGAATLVGAAVVGAVTGVAVADEPQAKITASKRAKGPRIIVFGFLNQWFKTD